MSAVTLPQSPASTAARLYQILASVAAGVLPPPAACLDVPLRELGLDSARFVAFLLAIEEQLGYVWTDDVPREALATLGTVTELIASTERNPS